MYLVGDYMCTIPDRSDFAGSHPDTPAKKVYRLNVRVRKNTRGVYLYNVFNCQVALRKLRTSSL